MEDDNRTYRFRAGPVFHYRTARMALPYNRRALASFASLDVVHSHTPFSLAYAAMTAALRHRLPHVQTYHTYLSEYRHYVPRPFRPPVRATETYSALLCNRCTTITVPTTPIRAELLRYGVKRPIHVVPFGADMSLYERPIEWDPRTAYDLDDDAPLLLYAGRIAMEKNLLFVLRAFDRIRVAEPRATMIFTGDGPLRPRLEEESRRLGIESSVRFTGFIPTSHLVDLYRAADLFLFASKTETQGLVLVEAMAGGTPAVALPELGVREVVCDGFNGLYAPEDENLFAEAAVRILRDRALHEALSRGARETAQRMSVQTFTERIIEIYDEAMQTMQGRGPYCGRVMSRARRRRARTR
jgi:glycosyltransferase involved in cell wall biosynthesis